MFNIVGFVDGIVPLVVVCKTKPTVNSLTLSKTTVVELVVVPLTLPLTST